MNNKRRALIVGINHYDFAPLKGCINDALNMKRVLKSHNHPDDEENFACKLLVSSEVQVTRSRLLKETESLFRREGDLAILYFSGHGALNDFGGYLVTQDAKKYDEGVLLSQIVKLANQARNVREILIILDCCHGGSIANFDLGGENVAILRKGISILTSSMATEYSMEMNGQGLFTSILVEALKGGAADITGKITSAGLYNYVDKVLGPWDQRPVYKAHINELTTIKKCKPLVPNKILKRLIEYFEDEESEIILDPSYEPSADPSHPEHERIFGDLQKLVAASLVQPVEEQHMYFAAINKKSCKLTPLGKLYYKMKKKSMN